MKHIVTNPLVSSDTERAQQCLADLPPPVKLGNQTCWTFRHQAPGDYGQLFIAAAGLGFILHAFGQENGRQFWSNLDWSHFIPATVNALFPLGFLVLLLTALYRILNRVTLKISSASLRLEHSLFPFGSKIVVETKKIQNVHYDPEKGKLFLQLKNGSEKILHRPVSPPLANHLCQQLSSHLSTDPSASPKLLPPGMSYDRADLTLTIDYRESRDFGLMIASSIAAVWYFIFLPLSASALYQADWAGLAMCILFMAFLFSWSKQLLAAWVSTTTHRLDPEAFEMFSRPIKGEPDIRIATETIDKFVIMEGDEDNKFPPLVARLKDGQEVTLHKTTRIEPEFLRDEFNGFLHGRLRGR